MSRLVPKLIVVERDEYELVLYRMKLSRRYVVEKRYRIAIGTLAHQTPAGVYFIEWKAKNPDWKMPNSNWVAKEDRGKIVPGGHPDNPLKEWFLSLGGGEGVGIHGTASLQSIGTMASHGCIRMYPEDVIDLAKRVGVGTPVVVY